MKKTMLCMLAVMLIAVGTAGAVTWDFSNAGDYYLYGDPGTPPLNISYVPVITVGVGAFVPARPYVNSDDDPPYGSDWAAVFARVNTQATGVRVGDITCGGFTVTCMNHPDAVYGSLYLSPTGGSGSTVLINLQMDRVGSNGNYAYTFGLDSRADVLVGAPNWTYAQPQGSLDFAEAIDWINASAYSDTYAAFFGPQIGLSNTSETTFTVTTIKLCTQPVPEPLTMFSVFMGMGGVGAYIRRRLRAA